MLIYDKYGHVGYVNFNIGLINFDTGHFPYYVYMYNVQVTTNLYLTKIFQCTGLHMDI